MQIFDDNYSFLKENRNAELVLYSVKGGREEQQDCSGYALYAGLLFAFNLFLRWWSGELDADEYLMSAINTLILTAGFVWGDRYRRKNLANKKKIDELLNNKENNGF